MTDPDPIRESFLDLARSRGSLYRKKLDSWSGTDRAESEIYRLEAEAFRRLAAYEPLEQVISACDEEWRRYAVLNNRRVDDAPKIRTGPRAGQSCIEYRYVGPDRFESSAIFIRTLYRRIRGQCERETKV